MRKSVGKDDRSAAKISDPTTYVLRLTLDQANIVNRACELYARVRMGQFDEILHETQSNFMGRENFTANRQLMSALLEGARCIAFPDLPTPYKSTGTGHDNAADTAWDVYQVLRHAIAWHDHPDGGIGVCFDPPQSVSGNPLPKVEIEQSERR